MIKTTAMNKQRLFLLKYVLSLLGLMVNIGCTTSVTNPEIRKPTYPTHNPNCTRFVQNTSINQISSIESYEKANTAKECQGFDFQ